MELLEDRTLMTANLVEFPVTTAASGPMALTTGPDGKIWFTENQASKIAVMDPTTHGITEFDLPAASSAPAGITAGPDGNVWFVESGANKIGMINPTSHVIKEFAIPTASSQPIAIVAGSDGNLWFTETSGNRIGTINPYTHAITEFTIPTSGASPAGIALGADGNLWFTEIASSKIASINPTTHAFSEYATPTKNSQPYGITAGTDGRLWFTENNTNKIGVINPTTHQFSEYVIPTANSGPLGITEGPDGNIWFAEFATNQIGMINPTTHAITETALATANQSPALLAAGPGGTLWFSEFDGNQIGEVMTSSVVTASPVSTTVTSGQMATFVASASGLPMPTVQWYVSADGGANFTALTANGQYFGVNTSTLTVINTTTAMNGYQYQAVFTNGVSPTPTATTSAAVLTVSSALSITPALPEGTVAVSYNQMLSVVGSTSPLTLLSVNAFDAGGTGLTLANITTNAANGTLTINGTPTGAGTATFIVTVANTAGDNLTKTLTVTIKPPLSIATSSLPAATAGSNYHQTINVVGGAMPYATFTVTNFNAGTTGLTADQVATDPTTGTITINGTPTAGGAATFTVTVTDLAGVTVTRNYTITVNPALVITPSLPSGTVGTSYHQTLNVTGGGTPYATFTVTGFNAGTTGLSASNITTNAAARTITINASPTAAGTFTFTVNVADAVGAVLTKTYSVTINPALTITPSLPQGTAGTAYHQAITVTGGATPYTTFTVTGFSAGATGLTAAALTINPATGTIAINGTPTAAGTAAFTVSVVEPGGSSLTKTFSIGINAAPTIGNLSATQWTAGQTGFNGSLAINGGTAPFSLAAVTGLPTGLTAVLNGNKITFVGTPTTAGTFANGTVVLRDTAGATISKTFSITINAAIAVGNLSATQWTIGRAGFNGAMAVSGGTGTLQLIGSTGLPTGMSIALNGNTLIFSGTPTASASFVGSVTLRDAVGATVVKTFTITVNTPPTVSNLSAAEWTAGYPGFNGTMTISAGTGPFTIASSTGLPTGLSAVVNGNTIRFVGTPSAAQTFAAGSITLRDAAGATVTRSFSITIHPPVVITTASLPAAKLAYLYSTSLQVTGGTGAITFALTAGSLPPGLRVSSNGIISGASRGFGTYTFSITATDAVGAKFTKQFILTLSFR